MCAPCVKPVTFGGGITIVYGFLSSGTERKSFFHPIRIPFPSLSEGYISQKFPSFTNLALQIYKIIKKSIYKTTFSSKINKNLKKK